MSAGSSFTISICGSILPFPLSFFAATTEGEETDRCFILASMPELLCTCLNFHRTPNWPLTSGTFESCSICRCTWKRACLGNKLPSCVRSPCVEGAWDDEELDADAMEVLFIVMVVTGGDYDGAELVCVCTLWLESRYACRSRWWAGARLEDGCWGMVLVTLVRG